MTNQIATGWSYLLEELKHSIKLHIQAAGGVSIELSQVGLKMVDAFEMVRDGDDPGPDLNVLASVLVRSLVDTAEDRLTRLNTSETEAIAMAMASDKLKLPKNNLHHKQHYLQMLAQAYRDLHRLTGHTYPPVTNLDGDEL